MQPCNPCNYRPINGIVIPNLKQLMGLAEVHFSLQKGILQGKSRERNLVEIRQIIMYIAFKLSKNTLVYIGNFFNRDHTTVIHAYQTVQNLLPRDEVFAEKYHGFMKLIKTENETI